MELQRRLTLPGVLESVRKGTAFVAEFIEGYDLGDDFSYKLELAMDEICTNIVEHGYGGNGSDKSIEIICRFLGDRVIIVVIDESSPFDPTRLDDPDPTLSLEEREEGGWGFYFVKQLMDKVDYQEVNGRNHLILEKRIR